MSATVLDSFKSYCLSLKKQILTKNNKNLTRINIYSFINPPVR